MKERKLASDDNAGFVGIASLARLVSARVASLLSDRVASFWDNARVASFWDNARVASCLSARVASLLSDRVASFWDNARVASLLSDRVASFWDNARGVSCLSDRVASCLFARGAFCLTVMIACGISIAASADEFIWKGQTDSDIFNPTEFTNTLKWQDGKVATNDSAIAKFTSNIANYAPPHYVRMPDDWHIDKFSLEHTAGKAVTTYVIGNTNMIVKRFSGNGNNVAKFYADKFSADTIGITTCELAGQIAPKTSLTFGGGRAHMRSDYAAWSNNPVIQNPIATNTWVIGSGSPSLFARRRTGELSGTWASVQGTPYLTYVSGTTGLNLAPGAAISGEGIPGGTYLRRIYSETLIEMSAPADVTSENLEMTFAAFPAETYQKVAEIVRNADKTPLRLNKCSKDDILEVEVMKLRSQTSSTFNPLVLGVDSGFEPGTIILHDTENFYGELIIDKSHVVFSTNAVGEAGIGKLCVTNSGSTARITVRENDVTATIGELVVNGSLTKDGPGTLSATLTADTCNQIEVNEGSLVLTADHDVAVSCLEVAEGAKLVKRGRGKLIPMSLDVLGSVQVEEGEIVAEFSAASFENIPSGAFFHLDAANTNTMTFTSKYGKTNFVQCWRDVNGGENAAVSRYKNDGRYVGGFLVTNALNGLPVVDYGPLLTHPNAWGVAIEDARFHNFTRINEVGDWTDYVNVQVREAFIVIGSENGGNAVLGFFQDGVGFNRSISADYSAPIFAQDYPGEVRLNGKIVDPRTTGLSGGYDVLSIAVNSPVTVDSFGTVKQRRYVGGQQLAEVIIYEKALTSEERSLVNEYLLQKWFNKVPSPAFGTLSLGGGSVKLGSAPLNVKALDGAGEICGGVTVADGGVIRPQVGDDGIIQPIEASGAVMLSGGKIIIPSSEAKKVKPGIHTLMSGSSLACTGEWNVECDDAKRQFRVIVTEDSLKLNLLRTGTCFIIR